MIFIIIILIILVEIGGVGVRRGYDDVDEDVDAITERNIPSHERQALHDLYISTNGDEWIYQDGDGGHWNFTDPDVNPCSSSDPWQGLNCTVISSEPSDYYCYISEITLSDFNLRGTIPESIGSLHVFTSLDVRCFL